MNEAEINIFQALHQTFIDGIIKFSLCYFAITSLINFHMKITN